MAMIQKAIGWVAVVALTGATVGVAAGGGAASWGEFGNNVGPTEDNGFSWPDSAESWAGWANTNADIYPMSFPQGGAIRFTASAENGDVSIRFRFERLPFPDVDPAFETDAVTLSGGPKSYCVSIAARPADETYSSLILYSNTRNTFFGLADAVVTEGDDCSVPVNRNPDAIPVAPVWLLGLMGVMIAAFGWRRLR